MGARRGPPSLTLPVDDPDPEGRATGIAEHAAAYVYDRSDLARGMPPWMARIPTPEWTRPESARAVGRLTDIARRLFSVRLGQGLRTLGSRSDGDPWARFHRVYEGRDTPWVSHDEVWRTDEAFGYQRLGGLAPGYLERVDAIPDAFHVTDADLRGVPAWPDGATIADMIAARRLWMVRHTATHGVPSKPGTTLCSPHTLFLVRDDGRLVPVAIQLFVDSDVVFTPKDDVDAHGNRTNRWLVAKMFVTNVDAQVYTLFTHTTLTHLVVEAAWGAMCRTVSARHPVRAFLAPHTEVTHVIGEMFRTYYAQPRGELVRLHQAGFEGSWALLPKLYADWTFADLDLPARHAARGWDRPEEPPGFVFRDDSRAHWDLLAAYVTTAMEALYANDDAVHADPELQRWAQELADPIDGCGFRGLPTDATGALATRAQLVTLLTSLVYQAVVQHSHVDSAAYTYFGFAPNMPLSLYLDPPRDHEVRYTDTHIAAGLPDDADVVLQLALPAGNHPFHPTPPPPFYDSRLAHPPEGWLDGLAEPARGRILGALDTWRCGLRDLARRQEARNATMWPVPYDVLHPDNMSNTIWY
ncbi:MAG: hypothetical protein H6733_17120 [Alphaproteobacteria bacterium]|nr:hypothetical protein [Alphaproteobacteria bacterium]